MAGHVHGMWYNVASFCLLLMLKLDTNIISKRINDGDLVPENFLDPSKVAASISDPTSTFLEFVSLYYSLFRDIQPIIDDTGLKVLSLLPKNRQNLLFSATFHQPVL